MALDSGGLQEDSDSVVCEHEKAYAKKRCVRKHGRDKGKVEEVAALGREPSEHVVEAL
jgi:hypothetical protein